MNAEYRCIVCLEALPYEKATCNLVHVDLFKTFKMLQSYYVTTRDKVFIFFPSFVPSSKVHENYLNIKNLMEIYLLKENKYDRKNLALFSVL